MAKVKMKPQPQRNANASFFRVPAEPTTAMLEALFGGMGNCSYWSTRRRSAQEKYQRMLEASPQSPDGDEAVE